MTEKGRVDGCIGGQHLLSWAPEKYSYVFCTHFQPPSRISSHRIQLKRLKKEQRPGNKIPPPPPPPPPSGPPPSALFLLFNSPPVRSLKPE